MQNAEKEIASASEPRRFAARGSRFAAVEARSFGAPSEGAKRLDFSVSALLKDAVVLVSRRGSRPSQSWP
jgi:hypothetical protein